MNRRSEQRIKWNNSVQYRTWHSGEYKTGMVKNISINGALLWLKEDLGVGSKLELLMGSHGKQQLIHMRVVRTEYTNHEDYSAYGCKVEMRMPIAA